MNATEYKVDRTGWRSGPWDNEPDRVEWRENGVPCLAVRAGAHGAWCGYVGVTEQHPWFGKNYHELEDVAVHGGLTYSSKCSGRICYIPLEGESDNVWWLGFDCAHAFDVMPRVSGMGGFNIFDSDSGDGEFGERYRDLDFVKRELLSLVHQVNEAVGS